jgi:hypothetical protein
MSWTTTLQIRIGAVPSAAGAAAIPAIPMDLFSNVFPDGVIFDIQRLDFKGELTQVNVNIQGISESKGPLNGKGLCDGKFWMMAESSCVQDSEHNTRRTIAFVLHPVTSAPLTRAPTKKNRYDEVGNMCLSRR